MYPVWINGPFGQGHEKRLTRTDFRTVLVMVPHLVAGTRLMDFLPLIESDHRVQAVFTVPDTSGTWHGTEEFVRAQGGLVVPWHQALQHDFDLVLDASRSDTEPAHGPIMVTPHGAGTLKSRLRPRKGGATAQPRHGLVREILTRQGRVIPSALVLTHDDELDALEQSCPEALPAAVVAGDICLDRMQLSRPYRQDYRRALNVDDDQTLVVVSSTWSSESVFGQQFGLYRRLLDELPRRQYRIAAVLHPNIWTVHSRRQVRAWLSDCTRDGLALLPPEEGWRAAMVGADVLLGDHGSTTQYGAAVGVPTLLATFPENNIRPDSPAAILARTTPHLDLASPLAHQLHTSITQAAQGRTADKVAQSLTSRPGQAARILRTAIYDLLGIPEPTWPVPTSPLPLPCPVPATLSIQTPEGRDEPRI